MKKTYNWAILGCGRIARKFSNDLKLLHNAHCYAAASTDEERARSFATEMGFSKWYGSYEAMLADPAVDIVYVATPHSLHHKHVIMSLNAGKAVLNEKAFALTHAQALEMVEVARIKRLFLMEAFWTMFQPSYQKALEIIHSGALGKVKIIRSDFAFKAIKDPEKRLYNPKLGGGSLLDIGIYPVFAALSVLGKPKRIKALATFADTGIEESLGMVFQYAGGEIASLHSSFAAYSSVTTEFNCEEGVIHLARRWMSPTKVTVWRPDLQEVYHEFETEGFGYQHEAAHVMDCLDHGLTESALMPLDFTLLMMATLDRIRYETGIVFPGVKEKF